MRRRHAFHVICDVVGVLTLCGSLTSTPVHVMFASSSLLQTFVGLLRIRLDRVLYLDFQHQMGAALEIESQANVVTEICRTSAVGFRKPDNAEKADQDRHDDDHGPSLKFCFIGL